MWLSQNWSWLWVPPGIILLNHSTWVCPSVEQMPEASPGTSPAAPGLDPTGVIRREGEDCIKIHKIVRKSLLFVGLSLLLELEDT